MSVYWLRMPSDASTEASDVPALPTERRQRRQQDREQQCDDVGRCGRLDVREKRAAIGWGSVDRVDARRQSGEMIVPRRPWQLPRGNGIVPRRPWHVHSTEGIVPRRPWHVLPADGIVPRRPWHAPPDGCKLHRAMVIVPRRPWHDPSPGQADPPCRAHFIGSGGRSPLVQSGLPRPPSVDAPSAHRRGSRCGGDPAVIRGRGRENALRGREA